MAQGITGLPVAQGAPQAPQQPQAPGQAAPFRAMTPQQPKTPAAEIAPYEGMDLQRIVAAFQQRPSGPLLGLITKKAEAEKLRQRMAQQQAMGAYAQQGPQTVKDIALANAMQAMRPTQMARHGGIMHGYAGGGAVAFEDGGRVQKYTPGGAVEQPFYRRPAGAMPAPTPGETFFPATTGFEGMSLPEFFEALFGKAKASIGSEEENVERRNRERAAKALEERMGPLMRSYKGRPSMSEAEMQAAYEKAGLRATPPSVPAPAPAPAEQRASRPATGGPAAAAPATQAPTGVGALIAEQLKWLSAGENPELARIGREAQKSAEDTAAMLQRMQGLSPEEAAARAQYYKTVEGAYEPQRKALEAARASTREGLLQSPEALARLAAAFGGAKRVGQGLSAAAGAAGEVLGERRKRAEQLEERYQTLSSQLAITTAQAQRADVEGDEKRKRELMLQAQGLKDRLLATQADLLKTGQAMRAQDVSGLASLMGAQAQMMQAGKPTDFQQRLALFRSDPKAYEAMFGSKDAQMMTRVQQVTNTDPLLKELAGKASLNLPGALEQYNARYRELIAQHAPELLLAGTGGAPGGGALSAATNIVRGGQQ